MTIAHDHRPSWYRFLLRVGKLRPTIAWAISMFWYVFGGFCTLLAMRLVLVDRLAAETTARASADSSMASDLLSVHSVLNELVESKNVGLRAICMDHTLGEQARIGVTCPPNLYKGAP